jgi:hypothetical protein
MDRNTVTNTFITLIHIKLSAKLSVKLTTINSFNTNFNQRLSSTAILDNARKW